MAASGHGQMAPPEAAPDKVRGSAPLSATCQRRISTAIQTPNVLCQAAVSASSTMAGRGTPLPTPYLPPPGGVTGRAACCARILSRSGPRPGLTLEGGGFGGVGGRLEWRVGWGVRWDERGVTVLGGGYQSVAL